MAAAVALLRKVGAEVAGAACIIELSFLAGRERLDVPVTSILTYDS
jgi:adenine phosphoribosyltransferase